METYETSEIDDLRSELENAEMYYDELREKMEDVKAVLRALLEKLEKL